MSRALPVLMALAALLAAVPAFADEWVDYFPYGEASLSPVGYLKARQAAAYAKRTNVACLQIVAHMDSMETHEFSGELGLRRAQAMATELVLLGVDPAIIEQDARGSSQLARPTDDHVPEQLNRRVVINVLGRTCAR